MEPITPGYINETLKRLRRIQKAQQIEDMPSGGVTLFYDMQAGVVTGSVNFPIEQIDTEDGSIIKAVDFAQ
jgi:hypothetical protein